MRLPNQTILATAVLTCIVGTTTTAVAHGGGGDIALFNTGGKTDVGFAVLDDDDINQELFDPDDRVFQAVLTPINRTPFLPYDFGSGEPGYDANEREPLLPGQVGSGLPSDALVTWRTLDVQHWSGSGAVTFTPAADVAAGYAAPTSGTTDPLGGFHLHPTFGLATTGGGALATGVYVSTLAVTVEGLAESDPFYLVTLVDDYVNGQADGEAAQLAAEQIGEAVLGYLAGTTADAVVGPTNFAFFGDAIRYVEALAVPEPGAGLLTVGPAVAWLMRRRR